MGWVVNATHRLLYLRERPGTRCIGGWVGPRAGVDGCGKLSPPTGIRSPDLPTRSKSLYRLSYPGPHTRLVHWWNIPLYLYLPEDGSVIVETCTRVHDYWLNFWYLHVLVYIYSKTCLKRNIKGPEHFSAKARFPFNQGTLHIKYSYIFLLQKVCVQICTWAFVWDSALDSDIFLLQKVCVQICTWAFVWDSALGSDLFLFQKVSVPKSAAGHSSGTVP